MTTTVVNVKHAPEACDVYIGRRFGGYSESPWHNPYVIGIDGTREAVIARYEADLRRRLDAEPALWDALLELEGKTLGCWCAPKACHGDVLVRLIEQRRAELSEARHPLGQATAIANELVGMLRPCCERIQIAGSIRRGKPVVKDIEIVAVPKTTEAVRDLFGVSVTIIDLLHERVSRMRADGEVTDRLDRNGRPAFGTRYKRLVYKGIGLDLFSVTPATWGVQLAIRTGPAEFSHRFMTPQRFGGNLPDHMIVRDGTLYRHPEGRALPMDREERARLDVATLAVVPAPGEEDFFQALNMPWLEPEDRV